MGMERRKRVGDGERGRRSEPRTGNEDGKGVRDGERGKGTRRGRGTGSGTAGQGQPGRAAPGSRPRYPQSSRSPIIAPAAAPGAKGKRKGRALPGPAAPALPAAAPAPAAAPRPDTAGSEGPSPGSGGRTSRRPRSSGTGLRSRVGNRAPGAENRDPGPRWIWRRRCPSGSWRPPSPRCPCSRCSTPPTSSSPSSTSSMSPVSAALGPGGVRRELRYRCAGTDPSLPRTNRFCHLPAPLLCLLSPARGQLRYRGAGADPALPRANRFCHLPVRLLCLLSQAMSQLRHLSLNIKQTPPPRTRDSDFDK